jgi:hypothetical protein
VFVDLFAHDANAAAMNKTAMQMEVLNVFIVCLFLFVLMQSSPWTQRNLYDNRNWTINLEIACLSLRLMAF